jgi:hypothetical protein
MNRKLLVALITVACIGILVVLPVVASWRADKQRELLVEQRAQSVFSGGAKAALEQSRQLTVLSIKPSRSFGYAKNAFHDHEVLGKTTVTGAAKMALLASLYNGLEPRPRNGGLKYIGIGCFMPRHGIRAVHKGRTFDLLICFSCMKVQVYQGNKQINQKFISHEPQPSFNHVLTQANVPLSRY